MPLIGRRRPLLRAAAVGGGAYYAGKQRAASQQREYEQEERIESLESQQAPPPAAAPPTPAGTASGVAAPAPASGSDMIEQLQKLGQLRDQGILTDDEFAQQKARILGS
ncbi:MAG TPA: SHOCT domain-containing protein [Conexibacter sp.]|jgi:hypothetical protein